MKWKSIVKIALLGTNRTKIPEAMIQELKLVGIEEEDPARLILKAATIMSMMRKAGMMPPEFGGEMPPVTEKRDANICSRRAVQYLNMILKRNDLPVLTEFLIVLKKHKKSLPPEALPIVLDKATKKPKLWRVLQPALGDRGRWLMTQNPEWAALSEVPNSDDWENGNTKQRVAYLKQQRSKNPTAALALLEATWPQENTTTRKKLMKALRTGLSVTDEAFLSARLSDKPKEISALAVDLLSQIPTSAFNQRMLGRLKKLIKIKISGKEKSLDVQLPKGVDDTMMKDGIKASLQLYRSGNKASQLAQMIKKLPLDFWSELTGLKPVELIALFLKNEYAFLLLNSVADAAEHHKNTEWSQLILQEWLSEKKEKIWQDFAPLQLIPVLDTTAYNTLTISGFNHIKFLPAEHTPLDFLLQQETHNWSKDLTLVFFDRLKTWMKSSESNHWGEWHIRKILSIAGRKAPAELYPMISRDWPEHLPVWGGWERDVSGCLTTLELRYKMEKALREREY